MYLASATRPNISLVVRKLSRFISNLGRYLDRVIHYLKGTISYMIHYTGYPWVLKWYIDSNWIYSADVIKSTSGYVLTFGGSDFS